MDDDSENSVAPISDAHTAKSLVRDLNMVVKGAGSPEVQAPPLTPTLN